MSKPSLPKGTRDFGPREMARRNYIVSAIKETFERYGFAPLETPTMENLSVLEGKYGEEGERLLYRVLNQGDFLKSVAPQDVERGTKAVLPKIAEKGLRYDLTVPFARYVAMNRGTLALPFKRYQVQPVWRGDRPQKGRYREFYQCDADVVGTDSLLCEAESLAMVAEVMARLKVEDYTVKINDRRILYGIAEAMGATDKFTDLCVCIDKLDKIGAEKVNEELEQRGFSPEAVESVLSPIYALVGGNAESFAEAKRVLQSSESGMKGIGSLEEVFQKAEALIGEPLVKPSGEKERIRFELTLARGLDYYTGAIFEVKIANSGIGSVSGGGRYDDLTSVFGLPDVSGMGFSFGLDRIYDALDALDLYPEEAEQTTQVLFLNFDGKDEKGQMEAYALPLAQELRRAGLKVEVYPSHNVKLGKQMKYADAKNIPFVVICGEDERANGHASIKDMKSGQQATVGKASVKDILLEAVKAGGLFL